jgi:serine/threonine-protein kinase
VVHEAENTWTGRRVAVKVLHAEAGDPPDKAERFIREARAASALRHPNVVDVLDMGQDPDGALYIVQELLEGEDLRARLAREGRLDEATALAIIAPVLQGLAAAHAAGVVHRDIKPANLFLARGHDGAVVPKVIDFGVARDARQTRTTQTGEVLGTPADMAPEQLRGEREVTPAADVWSVGVVLHEMLCGVTPFAAASHPLLVHRVLSGERAPLSQSLPEVSARVREVIERALHPEADRRFGSAAAMREALEVPATATPSPSPRRFSPMIAAVALITALVILAAEALR